MVAVLVVVVVVGSNNSGRRYNYCTTSIRVICLSVFDLRFWHLLADVFDFVEQLAIDVVFTGAGQTFDELRCSAGRTVVQRHAKPALGFRVESVLP